MQRLSATIRTIPETTLRTCLTAYLSHEERVSRFEGNEFVEVEQDIEQSARQVPMFLQVPQHKAPFRAAMAHAQLSLRNLATRRVISSKALNEGQGSGLQRRTAPSLHYYVGKAFDR